MRHPVTYFIVQYLVVYLLDIVGQDIDIPVNILNIYYVFSFIDPKTCKLFWLSKKHRGWIQKLDYIGPQYSIELKTVIWIWQLRGWSKYACLGLNIQINKSQVYLVSVRNIKIWKKNWKTSKIRPRLDKRNIKRKTEI